MNFKLEKTDAFSAQFEYGTLNISSNAENGFRPVQLLVSSLVGCSGGLLKTILEKKRIAFDTIHVEADVERNGTRVNKVTKISLHYIVFGKNLNIKQVQKSLNIVMRNCSMIESVKNSIEVVETIGIRER